MANRAKTRERMRRLLERWQRSGESAAAFSRRHGINPQKLAYWKRVLGKGLGRETTPAQPRFVPVRVVDEGSRGGTVEIVIGASCRLLVQEGVSRELLRDIVAVVREGC
jgi:transposase-like protein